MFICYVDDFFILVTVLHVSSICWIVFFFLSVCERCLLLDVVRCWVICFLCVLCVRYNNNNNNNKATAGYISSHNCDGKIQPYPRVLANRNSKCDIFNNSISNLGWSWNSTFPSQQVFNSGIVFQWPCNDVLQITFANSLYHYRYQYVKSQSKRSNAQWWHYTGAYEVTWPSRNRSGLVAAMVGEIRP